jgi:hypothetical protein
MHSRIVKSAKSAFYLCQRSLTDDRFPKYPRLPVVRCVGYERAEPDRPSDPDKPPF